MPKKWAKKILSKGGVNVGFATYPRPFAAFPVIATSKSTCAQLRTGCGDKIVHKQGPSR
jgi:hypothetical protein